MIPKIRLNYDSLSKLYWKQVFENIEIDLDDIAAEIRQTFKQQAGMVEYADYKTGSISFFSALCIYAVTRFHRVNSVLEVGTFIGNSTLAMARAVRDNALSGNIYTCDLSNSIDIQHDYSNVSITQFRKQTSAQMFSQLAADNVVADLVFLDGRISNGELPLIRKVSTANTVFVFDDFEGVEKGVVGASLLLEDNRRKDYALLYPCADAHTLPLATAPLQKSQVAALVPYSMFGSSAQ